MMDTVFHIRASVFRFLYVYGLKPILFLYDPEKVHTVFARCGRLLGACVCTRQLTKFLFFYSHTSLKQHVFGIEFSNPVGLSAGFDKDGELVEVVPSIGFGFAEIGSVTDKPYEGNPKPRLWRLPHTKSLGVWYGLKNKGASALVSRMKSISRQIPFGISVAMTNCVENNDIDHAIDDFVRGCEKVKDSASYITINISCPNTQGGQPFLVPENFDRLMKKIDAVDTDKPICIKLSPDMNLDTVDRFLEISRLHRVHGIICSNLTKDTSVVSTQDTTPPRGGMSGKAVFPKAVALLSHMYKKSQDRFVFIYSGGIFTADDVYMVMRSGAHLVQLITGMVFEGPQLIGELNRGLVNRMKRDGVTSVQDIVGVDCR